MNKLAAVAQLSVCFVLLFCISGNGQTKPAELVGSWKITSTGSEALDLKSDGTGMRRGVCWGCTEGYFDHIKWKVENGNIVITYETGTLKLKGEYIEKKSGKALSNVLKGWMEGRPAELVGTWEWESKDYKVLEFKSDGNGIERLVWDGKSSTKDFRWYVENKTSLMRIFSDSSKEEAGYSVEDGKTLTICGGACEAEGPSYFKKISK